MERVAGTFFRDVPAALYAPNSLRISTVPLATAVGPQPGGSQGQTLCEHQRSDGPARGSLRGLALFIRRSRGWRTPPIRRSRGWRVPQTILPPARGVYPAKPGKRLSQVWRESVRLSTSVSSLQIVRTWGWFGWWPLADGSEKLFGRDEPYTLPPHLRIRATRLRRIALIRRWKDSLRHLPSSRVENCGRHLPSSVGRSSKGAVSE